MRKEVKVIIVLILSILIMNIKVEAATGKGICYKKTILDDSGYCKLDASVKIDGKPFADKPLMLTDGINNTPAAKFGYHGIIEGKDQGMFCIDSNLSSPGDTVYPYARPFNLDADYDRAIAKVYSMYVNDVVYVMNSSGISFEEASRQYIQIANVVMRTLTIKYNYDIVTTKDNVFDNVYAQFEGKAAPTPKLVEGTEAYKLAQKYYCSAVLSCKECDKVADAKSFCSSLAGVSTSALSEFKFGFSVDPKDIENTGTNPDQFEKIVPVKISGIDKLLVGYSSYKITNPNFYITKIDCDNDKLSCEPVDAGQYSKNLIENPTGTDYIVKVKISGKTEDFKNETNAKILIDYKFYHILDTNNLSVLRYHLTAQKKQRMIALMPNREQKGDAKISITTPSMCEVREEGGQSKFYYGGVEHQELPYMQKGCCNLESNQIKTEAGLDYFMENCATKDEVILDTKCDNDNDPNNMSESVVRQQSIDKIMKIVNMVEDSYDKNLYDYNQLKNQLKKTDNNRDDVYMADVQADNDYCELYTSEQQLIAFPGTVEATSGRFFIFADGEQPRVEGKIYANFHTDYARWKKDYLDAIEKEKTAYTDWQTALAVENAKSRLTSCVPGGSCNCQCCGGPPAANGTSTCGSRTCNCQTSYSGTNTQSPTGNTYFKADGTDLSGIVFATRSCSCGSGTSGSVSSTSTKGSSSYLRSVYQAKVTIRKNLETYKSQCESKSQIATKWNYYLEPDLVFTYKQEYYDAKNNKVIELKTPVELEVSKRSEKYWPMVSTNPVEISGSKKGQLVTEKLSVVYGAGNDKVNQDIDFDTTKDYSIGYEQTLYYIPKEKYYSYSLLPNGNYVTNVTSYKSGSYIDVGYVFNVEITNYKNEYYTWFTMDNTGHLMRNPNLQPKLKSNVQKSIDIALENINDPALKAIYNDEEIDQSMFNNICYYPDEEILYQREREDDNSFRPQYFYRSVALNNLFPNTGIQGRTIGANWSSKKGQSAREEILNLGDEIYNDKTKEHLEGSFILTPTIMQDIRKEYNKNRIYSDFNLTCREPGKECLSSLLTELVNDSEEQREILEQTRASGWKYFIDGSWVRGSISEFLKNGYPEEDEELPDWP